MNHAVFELFPCLLRAKQSKDQGNDLMEHLARMQTYLYVVQCTWVIKPDSSHTMTCVNILFSAQPTFSAFMHRRNKTSSSGCLRFLLSFSCGHYLSDRPKIALQTYTHQYKSGQNLGVYFAKPQWKVTKEELEMPRGHEPRVSVFVAFSSSPKTCSSCAVWTQYTRTRLQLPSRLSCLSVLLFKLCLHGK